MLGRHSPQGELFRPDNIHLDHAIEFIAIELGPNLADPRRSM